MTNPTPALQLQRVICSDLDRKWRAHVKICHKCLVKTAAQRRFCDDGWALAGEILAAKQLLDQLVKAAADQTPPLF